MSKSVSYYMAAGHWFLSLYNDDGESRQVSFMTKVSPELTRNCPKGCHGKGECVLGRCQCKPGFDGPDCGQSKYPENLFIQFYRSIFSHKSITVTWFLVKLLLFVALSNVFYDKHFCESTMRLFNEIENVSY